MRVKYFALAGAVAAGLGMTALATTAQAQEGIYVPLMTYRTGPFAGSGIPIANGMHDYLSMLNARDGGVGGAKLLVEECETGYDTKKGVECYESVKGKKPVMTNPWSTGITLQLIPKASVDKIPVLSMAYGLSAAAVGKDFPWAFNPPLTYWDALSIAFKFMGQKEGSLDKLKGKTIGYIFFDGGYGREPIPLLEQFAKDYGFTVKLYPVPAAEMQNQSGLWLNVRRDRPDYMVMWGWGAMNPTAVKEAAKINYPMDHLISVYWGGGEDDARPTGADAKGYTALGFSVVGADFPAIQDIIKTVVDKGGSQVTSKDKVGESHYNKGVYNSVLIAEAIRNAQRITGKKMVTGEDVRRGLESLNINEARWKELGLPGFGSEVKVTCSDHSGHQSSYMQQWDGTKWVKISDWITPMTDKVQPLLDAAASDYVGKDPAWPKRSEPCDKSS